jgi:outer membrane protein TolC
MMKTSLTMLSAALLLGACATPTPVAPTGTGFAAPAQWQGLATRADAVAPDWAGLLDPQLAALQARALTANHDLAQALLRLQAAERQRRGAALARQPTPSLSLSAGAQRALESPAATQRSVGVSAGVAFEADLWQRLAALEQAQAAGTRAAEADLAALRLLLRSEVASRYWQLASLRQERPLLQAQLDLAEEALQLTRVRVREGKLLPIEVDKAAGTLQQLELQLAQNEEGQQQQRLQLGLLLAEPGLQVTAATLPGAALPDWRALPPEEALPRRPDVQQARAQVDAALARLQATEAARYPSLSFSLGASSGGTRWDEWLKNPLGSLSSSLLVPLIDWRRLDLQRDDASGDLQSAALRLRDSLHRALVEVEQLAAEQQRLQAAARATESRVAEAREAERLAALQLEVGRIGRLDWLQARNARLAVEGEQLRLRLAAWLNQAGLHKALAS